MIIFAMLVMILLFNTSNNILNSDRSTVQTIGLLPLEAVIMKIDFGQVQVERIGQGWRVLGSPDKPYQPEQIVQAWHQGQLTPVDTAPESQPYVVVIWLAGEEQGRVFKLYVAENQIEVSRRIYQLHGADITQLLVQ